jgi:hypothetical protein
LIELEFPESPVALDPGRRLPHRRGDERGAADATLLPNASQPRALEHAHMLGHRGEAHLEPRRELADGPVAGGEPSENRAPSGIGERRERSIEGRMLVNHVVYYRAMPADAQEREIQLAGPRRGSVLHTICAKA